MSSNLFLKNHNGYYGRYGGAFIPEILRPTIEELICEFEKVKKDSQFWKNFLELTQTYSGRPTPITHLKNLSKELSGAQIYVKREDLNHTGSHKINNVLGQGLLTQFLKKSRVIAETGAGQHGIATATMAAKMGLKCTIYMGAVDIKRQRPNVFWMENLGAEVVSVTSGAQTLKDAISEAMRDWTSSMKDSHYVLGTACGPHPFPEIVSWFQRIIGIEAKEQILSLTQKLPNRIYACVGGGSNAIGLFQGFLDEPQVELIGVEAGGFGPHIGEHASRLAKNSTAKIGVAHGYKTQFLQNSDGQMEKTSSISAGLDYTGVSPILAHLKEEGKIRFERALDKNVILALKQVMRLEGIIPALESSHAFATAIHEAKQMSQDEIILINQSGRADKDIFTVAQALKDQKWTDFLKTQIDEI